MLTKTVILHWVNDDKRIFLYKRYLQKKLNFFFFGQKVEVGKSFKKKILSMTAKND